MNSTVAKSNKRKRPSILLGIIIAIIIGTIVGGWFPDFAVRFNILGEIFLNSLMMIVVPIVMLSLIIGITHLGDIRNLGSIGSKTVVYYLVTRSIAGLSGILMVNIIDYRLWVVSCGLWDSGVYSTFVRYCKASAILET